MRKIKVEWMPEQGKWISVDSDLGMTGNNNYRVRVEGVIYVFGNLREGTPVITRKNGCWVKAGRIVRGNVFLGEGVTYAEYCETPEGKAQMQTFLQSLRNFKQHDEKLATPELKQ